MENIQRKILQMKSENVKISAVFVQMLKSLLNEFLESLMIFIIISSTSFCTVCVSNMFSCLITAALLWWCLFVSVYQMMIYFNLFLVIGSNEDFFSSNVWIFPRHEAFFPSCQTRVELPAARSCDLFVVWDKGWRGRRCSPSLHVRCVCDWAGCDGILPSCCSPMIRLPWQLKMHQRCKHG